MILTLLSIVLTLGCLGGAFWLKDKDDFDWLGFICFIAGIFFCVCLLCCLIVIVFSPIDAHLQQAKFEAFQATVDTARAEGRTYELAALTQKGAEMNAFLAGKRYQANLPWTSWFYSRDWFKIKPIR